MKKPVTIRAAWITFSGALLAAIVGGIFLVLSNGVDIHVSKEPESVNSSGNELIGILELRAESIIKDFENAEKDLRERAVVFRKAGKKVSGDLHGTIDFLESLHEEFKELHGKHIDAIKEGNQVLAHEVLGEIHDVLGATAFLITLSDYHFSSVRYWAQFPPEKALWGIYPGQASSDGLADSVIITTWGEDAFLALAQDTSSTSSHKEADSLGGWWTLPDSLSSSLLETKTN